jgi:ubiquinone biosynthesis protein UbiJ
MSLSAIVIAGLEQAVNAYLDMDPQARERMGELHGRVIAFELEGLGQKLYLIPGQNRLQILSGYEGDPDCTLRGTPLALAAMSEQRGKTDRLFSGDVEITGDTDLAHRLGKILGAMDIDWEEQLSRFSGDIIAHEIGNAVRSTSRWGRSTLKTLKLDFKEYLQEESGLLPVRREIEIFLGDVDALREDTDRLEARIERLRSRPSGKTGKKGGGRKTR